MCTRVVRSEIYTESKVYAVFQLLILKFMFCFGFLIINRKISFQFILYLYPQIHQLQLNAVAIRSSAAGLHHTFYILYLG